MFHMFRGLIFISITGNAVPLHFQTVLNDFWAISNYNRGGMLAYLYRQLCKTCLKKRRQITRVSFISLCTCILNYLITRINEILNNKL